MPQSNKTSQIQGLLLILGIIIVILGIYFGSLDAPKTKVTVMEAGMPVSYMVEKSSINKILSFICSSIGSILFGISFSWWIEERYKRKDERSSALDLFEKSIGIIQETSRYKTKYPNEKDIAMFREQKLYFYHSTVDKDGELFWHAVELDFSFSQSSIVGKLTAQAIFMVKDGRTGGFDKLNYSATIFRTYVNDNIALVFRRQNSQEPLCISIFDHCIKRGIDNIYGFMYHDDWIDKWRLSPSILAFKPINGKFTPGPVSNSDGKQLQIMWDKNFGSNPSKTIFQKY